MRIVVLAPGAFSQIQLRILDPIQDDPDLDIVGVVIDGRSMIRVKQLRSEWTKGRGGYLPVMIAKATLKRLRPTPSVAAETWARQRGVPDLVVAKLNEDATIEFIRRMKPDVIVRLGFGNLPEPLLSITKHGVLSYHYGNIRYFRGQPAGFWEVYEGVDHIGVTVQRLAAGLDGGTIVAELRLPIGFTQSWASVCRMATERSPSLMHVACRRLLDPGMVPETVPPADLGYLYTTPTLRQWLTMHRRVLLRRLVRMTRR